MATYVVPQDVEADDKLIGPFGFRQFVYLMIIAGLIGVGILLYRIIWPLCLIVIPPILFLAALALPLKKDQPMETYLSAIVTYYLKPRKRLWEPGQSDAMVEITAPKVEEKSYTKGLSQEEVSRRLSFLAEVLDTEGYSINGGASSSVNNTILEEASDIEDMFDAESHRPHSTATTTTATQPTMPQPQTVAVAPQYYDAPQNYVKPQSYAIPTAQPTMPQPQIQAPAQQQFVAQIPTIVPQMPEPTIPAAPTFQAAPSFQTTPVAQAIPTAPVAPTIPAEPTIPIMPEPTISSPNIQTTPVLPNNLEKSEAQNDMLESPDEILAAKRPTIPVYKAPTPQIDTTNISSATVLPDLNQTEQSTADTNPAPAPSEKVNLAFDQDLSIETIAKEANRINKDEDNSSSGEVYVSLH